MKALIYRVFQLKRRFSSGLFNSRAQRLIQVRNVQISAVRNQAQSDVQKRNILNHPDIVKLVRDHERYVRKIKKRGYSTIKAAL
jgi:hypothetical protein